MCDEVPNWLRHKQNEKYSIKTGAVRFFCDSEILRLQSLCRSLYLILHSQETLRQ